MADTWELLYENSFLTDGDAWEHLNSPKKGGNSPVYGTVVQIEAVFEIDCQLEPADYEVKYVGDHQVVVDLLDMSVDIDFEKEVTEKCLS